VIAAMLLLSGWASWQLPPDIQIPIHWNGDPSAPDRFAGKEGLLFFPLLALAVTALLALFPATRARTTTLYWSEQIYGLAWLTTVLTLAAMHTGSVVSLFA
jgi:hypothetical protein